MKQTIKIMDSLTATHKQLPKFNAYQGGYGAHGKTKYDRNKLKREFRRETV